MLVRGNALIPWLVKPDGDPSWNGADWGRAATLEARWKMMGVREDERRRLLPAAIWRAKFPGMIYSADVTRRLDELDVTRN